MRGAHVAARHPSPRPGACEPCRAGQHHACAVLAADAVHAIGPDLTECTCYDDAWEAHDRLTRN